MILGSYAAGSCGAASDRSVKIGNSMFTSMLAHLSHVTSAIIMDLVLLLFTGRDSYTYSFDFRLFLHGTGISNSITDVE